MASIHDGGSWTPDYGVPPGDILAEHLEARGWSQAELARRCGKSPKMISEIISGRNPIEPETALALERVLGMKAEIWNGIEADWRIFKAREADRRRAEQHAAWVRSFPLLSLKRRGIINDTRDLVEARDSLLAFFGVASETAYSTRWEPSAVAYRHSKTKASSPQALRVWLRLGELAAERVHGPVFDPDGLSALLPELRRLTLEEPGRYIPEVREMCLAVGVVVAIVAPVDKACLSGAAYRLPDGRGVAQLSLRHKSNDHFWFTLFHELGHLLLHKRTAVFVDDEGGSDDEGLEAEADEFAEEKLVGRTRLSAFCSQRPRSRRAVDEFAEAVGIHPGVVVGMLQHRRVLPWTHLNDVKQKLDVSQFAAG
jgi:HTH-type transcriptional regulator/antitoxin HigA